MTTAICILALLWALSVTVVLILLCTAPYRPDLDEEAADARAQVEAWSRHRFYED